MDTHQENRSIRSMFTSLHPPLPCEIVTQVLDYAYKYHPTVSISIPSRSKPITVTSGDKLLLLSPCLTALDVAFLRRITFAFTSKDQGWSSSGTEHHGTYDHSWTWFDALLLKGPAREQIASSGCDPYLEHLSYDDPALKRFRLVCNRHAGKTFENYVIEVERLRGHELFAEMEVGDRIGLMASARYPLWENRVQAASLQMWVADRGESSG